MRAAVVILLVFGTLWTVNAATDAAKECSSPLGLQSGSIPDSALSVSVRSSGVNQIRLNSTGGWFVNRLRGQWLQVKFTNVTNITAIATQGHSEYDYWTALYSLYHSFDGTHFQPYHQQELIGNADRNSVVKQELDQPIITRFLRVYPFNPLWYNTNPVLRLELYGCPAGTLWTVNAAKGAAKECSSPLGLQSGSIPDSALSASVRSSGVNQTRLNSTGGWFVNWERGQWLQVKFTNVTNITAIATQGHSEYDRWTNSYSLYHSFDGTHFEPYHQQWLIGNADRNSVVKQELDQPIITRFLRVYPLLYYKLPALRLELYGCPAGTFCTVNAAKDAAKECSSPLGLQSGSSPDSALTASVRSSGVNQTSLNSTGGWFANRLRGQWLQVKFTNVTKITAIATRGHSEHDYWTTWYSLYHSFDGTHFEPYHQQWLIGNADRNSVVKQELDQPIITRFLRVYPLSYYLEPALRLELYGCPAGTLWTVNAAKDAGKECSSPLGLQSGSIPDSALTASVRSSGVNQTRLNSTGGWFANGLRRQWLQMKFTIVTNITAIATQGHSEYDYWTTFYSLYHCFDGTHFEPCFDGTYFQSYHQQWLIGNADRNSVVKQELDQPIITRFLRVYPLSYYTKPALRLELYGCPADISSSKAPDKISAKEPMTRVSSSDSNSFATLNQNSFMTNNAAGSPTSKGQSTAKLCVASGNTVQESQVIVATPISQESTILATQKSVYNPNTFPSVQSSFSNIYSAVQPIYPSSVQSTHSAASSKTFVHHTATVPLESASPLLDVSSSSGKYTAIRIAESSLETAAQSFSTAVRRLTELTSSEQPVMTSRLPSSAERTKPFAQTRTQSTVKTPTVKLPDVITTETGSASPKTVQKGTVSSTQERSILTPTPSTNIFAGFVKNQKSRDPRTTVTTRMSYILNPFAPVHKSRFSNVYSIVQEISPTSVHSTHSPGASKKFAHHTATVPLESTFPLLDVRFSSGKSTAIAESSQESTAQSFSTAVRRLTEPTSSEQPVKMSHLASSAERTEPFAQTRTQSTVKTPTVKLPDVITTETGSASPKTVQKGTVSSTQERSILTPTPSTNIYDEFENRLKNADPKNKSSLMAVANLTKSLLEKAGPNDGVPLLAVSKGVEDFALKYAKLHLNDTDVMTITSGEELVLQMRKIVPGSKTNVTIPQFKDTENTAFMSLPPGTFGNQSAYLVALVYKDIKSLLRQTAGDKLEVNSDLLAVTAETKEKKPLQKKVKIVFKHREGEPSAKRPTCVFWRPHRFNKSEGKWSKTGCSLSSWSSEHTECLCDHLTHFAVLMPVQKQIPEADKMALTVITYFGLALSMGAEILTILAFFLFSDMTEPRSQVRVNVTCALLAGQLVFLAGIRAISNPIACTAVALLLQFFYLAGFCWMSAEAFLLYVYVVRVFSNFELKLSCLYGFCWGYPAYMALATLVVALTKGEKTPDLIHTDHCWLSPKHGMSWTFNGTILSLIIINFFVLVSVIRALTNLQGAPDSKSESVRKAAKAGALLCPLLGITWAVGFLNFSGTLLISEYLFAILNSLQGFLIFILHTLRSTEIRRKALRKMREWCCSTLNNNSNKGRKHNKIGDQSQASPGLVWADKTTVRHRASCSTASQSSLISQSNYAQ